jgi:DNA-binding YbaB/EbfC family protein
MNQMQQMLMQAQKMQRELKKAHDELDAKEFKVSKNGMVDVVVMGNKSIKAIKITPDALSPDNAEMIEEALKMALEEAFAQIDKADAEIEEKVTGRPGGLGF